MTAMDVEELIANHPRVFHTMSATAWLSVQQHGLRSTRRLIDLFGLDAAERDRLLGAPRKQSTVLRAPQRAAGGDPRSEADESSSRRRSIPIPR